MQPAAANRSDRTRIVRWGGALCGLALLAILGVTLFGRTKAVPPEQLLRTARHALNLGDFAEAERTAALVPADAEQFAEAMLIAGEAATKEYHYKDAVVHYDKVPPGAGEETALARYCAGDVLWQQGLASAAEVKYRQALEARPDHLWTHERLGSMLCTFGRRWEAVPHLFQVLRAQPVTVNQLLLLGDVDSTLGLSPDIERVRQQTPEDPLPRLGQAKFALNTNDSAEASVYAREVLAANPDLIEAWAVLGRALQESGADDEFLEWHAQVPQRAEVHPDVWLARGLWAQDHDQLPVAVRCFWEAVQRFPDSRAANYHLGRALRRLDPPRPKQADYYLHRAELLEELKHVLFMAMREPENRDYLERSAKCTEELGRFWEAAAWCQIARRLFPQAPEIGLQLRRVSGRLSPDLPRVAVSREAGTDIDPRSFPLPDWKSGAQPSADRAFSSAFGGIVRFEDCARAVGIDFRYYNGAEPAGAGKLIYQNLGGGVAALDFDGDLWPDLYFPQGAPAPPAEVEGDHPYRDTLYRNRGDGRFIDVTAAAGLGDRRHSLGIAAGDIDNDGFPDLYLANAGRNRLYRNQGDGTFREISDEAGLSGRHCTASCLIADLNADSWPDLFEVNYLAEPEVYALTCQKDDLVRPCDPRLFRADPDRLFASRGDGRFQDVSAESGIVVPEGKGLGIVAADFTGSGSLNLFVANDGTVNFYFINSTPRAGAAPVFREAALEAGVAYSENGSAQASMGIAAGDVDDDGLIGLYVTNFLNEGSAFYHQIAPNVFQDARRSFGLRETTTAVLGFGTQFLDADLDGFADLIVTNGHIDDYTADGKPYRMRPQFFRNLSGRHFEELRPDVLGPFFSDEYLGRGLARIDWNRDGKEDAVISHLDAPAALLTNRTEPAGHYLALRFVGTDSARDAIGVRVECRYGDRSARRQLTAGDGYMASNERQLLFGLGDHQLVDELTVRWPSGRVQSFRQVAADRHWLAIEGRPALLSLPVVPLGTLH